MVLKKLFSLQNVIKKIVGNALLLKKISASPKNGNPPPPLPIKNNGLSLTYMNDMLMIHYPLFMFLCFFMD